MTGPFAKLRLPPDTFERHSIIARLAGPAVTVLDVGGIRGELGLFLPDAVVTTINIAGEAADDTFDGDRLPYADDSFDLAVSLDVLEHIPAPERSNHFSEMARVARRQVLICCPLGSPEHDQAEAELAAWFRETTGGPHRFLEEHLERGLPTADELGRLAEGSGLPHRIAFSGDFRRANEAFRRSTELRVRRTPGAAWAYARIRLAPRGEPELEEAESPWTNRAFVELTPGPAAAPHTDEAGSPGG